MQPHKCLTLVVRRVHHLWWLKPDDITFLSAKVERFRSHTGSKRVISWHRIDLLWWARRQLLNVETLCAFCILVETKLSTFSFLHCLLQCQGLQLQENIKFYLSDVKSRKTTAPHNESKQRGAHGDTRFVLSGKQESFALVINTQINTMPIAMWYFVILLKWRIYFIYLRRKCE